MDILINGNNVTQTLGIQILLGGEKELLSFPSLKAPETISWDEENGVEVNLISPVLDIREISILFYSPTLENKQAFITLLENTVHNIFSIPEINYSTTLRLLAGEVTHTNVTFTLKFVDDISYQWEQDTPYPALNWPSDFSFYPSQGVQIDGTDTTTWNLAPLFTWDKELQTPLEIKQQMIMYSAYDTGQTYGTNGNIIPIPNKKNSQEINLPCLIRCPFPMVGPLLFDTILRKLSSPGIHVITYLGEDYSFYYQSMSVDTTFWSDTDLIVSITLTLMRI